MLARNVRLENINAIAAVSLVTLALLEIINRNPDKVHVSHARPEGMEQKLGPRASRTARNVLLGSINGILEGRTVTHAVQVITNRILDERAVSNVVGVAMVL